MAARTPLGPGEFARRQRRATRVVLTVAGFCLGVALVPSTTQLARHGFAAFVVRPAGVGASEEADDDAADVELAGDEVEGPAASAPTTATTPTSTTVTATATATTPVTATTPATTSTTTVAGAPDQQPAAEQAPVPARRRPDARPPRPPRRPGDADAGNRRRPRP